MKNILIFLVSSVFLVPACQELDPHLADGVHEPGMDPKTSETPDGAVGDDAGPTAHGGGTASCDTVRAEARAVLAANCASCHQAPASLTSLYGAGPFNFILELDKLTTAKSSLQTSYVVGGDPAKSYLYARVSTLTMPPPGSPPLTTGDMDILRQWITSCIGGTTGWDAP